MERAFIIQCIPPCTRLITDKIFSGKLLGKELGGLKAEMVFSIQSTVFLCIAHIRSTLLPIDLRLNVYRYDWLIRSGLIMGMPSLDLCVNDWLLYWPIKSEHQLNLGLGHAFIGLVCQWLADLPTNKKWASALTWSWKCPPWTSVGLVHELNIHIIGCLLTNKKWGSALPWSWTCPPWTCVGWLMS